MRQELDPATPLPATLSAAEWNVILTALHDVPAPYRIVSPLIDKLTRQLIPRPQPQESGLALADGDEIT